MKRKKKSVKLAKFAVKRKQLKALKGGNETRGCTCTLKEDGTIYGPGVIYAE